MTGRRHLRLVAEGDDGDPPPSHPAVRRRDGALYERTLAELSRRGWHPAVTSIVAAEVVARLHAARDRAARGRR